MRPNSTWSRLLQNRRNSKLGPTRNAAIAFSDTELFLALDADNALLPDCLDKCIAALDQTGAAFVYPTISLFGDRTGQIGLLPYDPALLQCANYIDAMAMVRKACWIAVGGYSPLDPMGWEDYEFWCKFAEKGFFGHPLARNRRAIPDARSIHAANDHRASGKQAARS